jgi:hypothetical protein
MENLNKRLVGTKEGGFTLSCECIEVIRGIPWLDTVDQEHIPLEVINNCGFDAELLINISAGEETLYLAKVKVISLSKHKIEIVTDKYYEALDIGVNLVEGGRDLCRKFIRLSLR